MQNAVSTTPSRRAVLAGAALGPALAGCEGGLRADTGGVAAEGTPGPGKILVWVDEDHWRALVGAATALGPRDRTGPEI